MPSTEPAATLAIPENRDCRPGTYQALLSPNGRETFFVPEIQRSLLDPSEPLARFLPPATFTPLGRGMGGGRVAYSLPEAARRGGMPLRTPHRPQPGDALLPRAEIEAFTEAVAQFLGKAKAVGGELSPLQQQCRREFRLPNPDLEPEAYWIYGGDFDRRLLVLWGCERFARTALPLEEVVAVLRTREMAWADKQQLALKLALAPGEPLAQFLGQPTPAGDLIVGGHAIPARDLSAFQTFGRAQWSAFAAAAEEYCRKAGSEERPAFERELRREFRLPSLRARPGSFFRKKGGVAIAIEKWARGETVPLVRGFDEASDAVEAPLVEQLRARVRWQPPKAALVGAAAALAVALGATGWWAYGRGQPPALVEVKPADATTVALTFDAPIDPKSLEGRGAIAIADDKLRVDRVTVDPNDKRRLLVALRDPMSDGERYGVAIGQGLSDARGRPLPATSKAFAFYDDTPPQLVLPPSANGVSNRHLVLVFSKPIDEASLQPSAVQIAPSVNGQPGARLEIANASLDAEASDGTRVLVEAVNPFEANVPYLLTLAGVTDRKERRNRAVVRQEPFAYKDVLPPQVRGVTVDLAGLAFEVTFSKAVAEELQQADTAVRVLRPGKESSEVPLIKGGMKLDPSGLLLRVPFEATRLSAGEHVLQITRLSDRRKETAAENIAHPFTVAFDRTNPPRVRKIEVTGARLEVEFDRALAPASAGKLENYELLDGRREPAGVRIERVSAGGSPNKVALTCGRELPGGPYVLATRGVEDVFGARQTAPEYTEFTQVGPGQATRVVLAFDTNVPGPELLAPDRVRLRLNSELTPESASQPGNFRVQPTVQVKNVEHRVVQREGQGKSEVTLVFGTPLPDGIRIGAQGLLIRGGESYGPQSLRFRPPQPTAP